jgi:hypothetical protein
VSTQVLSAFTVVSTCTAVESLLVLVSSVVLFVLVQDAKNMAKIAKAKICFIVLKFVLIVEYYRLFIHQA